MCQLHRTAVIRHLSAAADLTHPNHESTIYFLTCIGPTKDPQAALQKPDQKPYLITFRPWLLPSDLPIRDYHRESGCNDTSLRKIQKLDCYREPNISPTAGRCISLRRRRSVFREAYLSIAVSRTAVFPSNLFYVASRFAWHGGNQWFLSLVSSS